MDADRLLELLRPLVLVVDGGGLVLDSRGGYGGFHGRRAEDFVGRNVLELVASDQVDELASYFLEAVGRSADTLALPLPFRVALVDPQGHEQSVDVIPTGDSRSDEVRFVVVVVPDHLQTAVSQSLEAEMAGAPRDDVKAMLCEELRVENPSYGSRWFLIDLDAASGPQVTTARAEDEPVAETVAAEVRRGWRPWGGLAAGAIAPIDEAELPARVRSAAVERGWRRSLVTPVHVDGTLVAAYLLLGRVPEEYERMRVDPNVAARIRRLVDATTLLIARWHDRDRLVAAATRDPLTGLANRDAFADALADADPTSTVLYVDVDRFKDVNDRYGHDVGDRVLIEIARRIASACRPSDVVARFGGDEFVVLLNSAVPDRADEIGRRILESVVQPMPGLDDPDRVTVSVGLAAVAVQDAVDTADQAMLRAKRAGRDRLVRADELAG